jgi:glycine/D-amino acid oxidase-like deaminating enzyme
MVRRFPSLADTAITHAWMGFVGYTFDEMPHLGERDGVHYAMGYCGSGVSLASYFGAKIGLQVLGRAEGDSPLTQLDFQSRPYYWGRPWFMTPALHYYRWMDERAA